MPACDQQVRTMKEIFHKYANSTGLHINFDKSSIIPTSNGWARRHAAPTVLYDFKNALKLIEVVIFCCLNNMF
jgi:hypothetical protein